MSRRSLSLLHLDRSRATDSGPADAIAVGLPPIAADSAGELVRSAVRHTLENGHPVYGERGSTEVLNQTLCQRNPRRRGITTTHSTFNPAVAVARLVWHLGADSDLDAIEFYEPRARLFSDDGKVLPGSNTGSRLLGGDGGPNQIRSLIARLVEDASSRRAMAVVWRPEDALRESRDIPCTVSLACHLREGQLLTTVSMRSNNALRLLPYNLFEFTMLAELISVEVNGELGPYWHSVLSLHVFDEDAESAERLSACEEPGGEAMPPMPGPAPLAEAARLVAHEARLRTAFREKRGPDLPKAVEAAEADLHPYWLGLYAVLAVFCATRASWACDVVDVERLKTFIPAALRQPS